MARAAQGTALCHPRRLGPSWSRSMGIVALLWLAGLLGCGVRGPPRPPDAPIAAPSARAPGSPDMDAGARGGGVQECEACEFQERDLLD